METKETARKVWLNLLPVTLLGIGIALVVYRWQQGDRVADVSSGEASVVEAASALAPDVAPGRATPRSLEPQAVAPTPRGPTAAATTIRTVDESGATLAGVEVFATDATADPAPPRRLGATDSEGRLRVAPALADPLVLVAKAEGFAPKDVALWDPVPADVEVRLVRGASISGFVVLGEAAMPAGSGTTVIAWAGAFPPMDIVRRAMRNDPRCHVTWTDNDGAFRLEGLAPDSTYALVAGTSGYAMARDAFPDVEVGARDVVLRLDRLFGAVVKLVEEGGDELRLPSNLIPVGNLPVNVGSVPGTYLQQPNFALELAGIEEGVRSVARDQYLFLGDDERSELGPLLYSAQYPGYAPVDHEFYALPVEQSVAEVEIPFVPYDQPRGSLRVVFEGVELGEGARSGVNNGASAGKLVLKPESWGSPVHVHVEDPFQGDLLIENIPHGAYRPKFTLVSSRFMREEYDAIEIGDTPATWTVDLSACGRVELRLQRMDGSLYSGPAHFTLMEGEITAEAPEGYAGMLLFTESPYVLAAVRGGTYTLIPGYPDALASRDFQGHVMEVVPGTTTVETLYLAR